MTNEDLAERVEARLRDEWPGTPIPLRYGVAPSTIRDDGATDTIIKLATRIVAEESALATPAPTGDDERVKLLAYAWLDHQGYSVADIAKGETETHEQAGCEYASDIGYYQHIDENENSLHPLLDAVSEASEWAYFAVEHFSRSHPETPTSETVTMTREELSAWVLANDAGFGMYKRQHWDGRVRELFDGPPEPYVSPALTPKESTDD